MQEAVIVDAVRTPGGKRNGKLSNSHPAALAAHVLKAIAERSDLDPAQVDDVVMGCVMQVGPQSLNIGRNAVLAAGWPESVPSTTVDRPDLIDVRLSLDQTHKRQAPADCRTRPFRTRPRRPPCDADQHRQTKTVDLMLKVKPR